MLRDMALDALTGGALGVVFIAGIYLLDVAQIGTLIDRTAYPEMVLFTMASGVIPFFAAIGVAAGVMLMSETSE